MLSREDNELLTRVGPGTPMGDTMRRYWIPALLARELPEPDCPPVRVRLLGEDLVAFRDTQGRIGLLDEFCPHRRASLFFGRNEECGLRCVYHGWKFDVDGQLRRHDERARGARLQGRRSAPPRIPSWSAAGSCGRTWAAAHAPPPPHFAWTRLPERRRHVSKVIQESNWLQGLEGGIDTSHAPILHRRAQRRTRRAPGFKPKDPFVRGKAPTLVVDLTDYGYCYAGIRPLDETDVHVRAYHFILPFHQIRPSRNGDGVPLIAGHIWVPMDDETTMVYNWVMHRARRAAAARTSASRRGSATAPATSIRPRSARGGTGRTTTCSIARSRRPRRSPASTASTSRTARCRRAWGPSSTAARSTSGPPTRP